MSDMIPMYRKQGQAKEFSGAGSGKGQSRDRDGGSAAGGGSSSGGSSSAGGGSAGGDGSLAALPSLMRDLLGEIRGMRSDLTDATRASARASRLAVKQLEAASRPSVDAESSDDDSESSDTHSDDSSAEDGGLPPMRKLKTTLQSSRRTQLSGTPGASATGATAAVPAAATETPMQKLRRNEWAKEQRRKHWFLSGAMPVSHKSTVLQARLGTLVKVSKQVLHTLTHLADFRVMDFEPEDGIPNPASFPFTEHMNIMATAIITVLQLSLPGKENRAEALLCRERLNPLCDQLDAGIALVLEASKDFRRAFESKKIRGVVAGAIEKDLRRWSDSVTAAVEDFARATGLEPPTGASMLPPPPVLVWTKLEATLRSDALLNTNTSLADATSSSSKNQPCRLYQKGTCPRTAAECSFSHKKRKRGEPAASGKATPATPTKTKQGKRAAKKAKEPEAATAGSEEEVASE